MPDGNISEKKLPGDLRARLEEMSADDLWRLIVSLEGGESRLRALPATEPPQDGALD